MATHPILVGICAVCGRYFDSGVLVFNDDREHPQFHCHDHAPTDGTAVDFTTDGGHDTPLAD